MITVIVLDELGYFMWKQVTPGYMYANRDILPLFDKPGVRLSDYPNGRRPAGGI
jgi:hypothetical protein